MTQYIDENRNISLSILDKLDKIINYYKRPGDGFAATLRIVASILSLRSGINRPWTWNYLHQVYNQKLLPSKKLSQEILFEYNQISGSPPIDYEIREVVVPKGFLSAASLVNTRSKFCKFCSRPFIPLVPIQIYCTHECQNKSRKMRRLSKNSIQNRR